VRDNLDTIPKKDVFFSPPHSAEVKNAWSYTSTPPIRVHSVVLSLRKMHSGNFTFYLLPLTQSLHIVWLKVLSIILPNVYQGSFPRIK